MVGGGGGGRRDQLPLPRSGKMAKRYGKASCRDRDPEKRGEVLDGWRLEHAFKLLSQQWGKGKELNETDCEHVRKG